MTFGYSFYCPSPTEAISRETAALSEQFSIVKQIISFTGPLVRRRDVLLPHSGHSCGRANVSVSYSTIVTSYEL